MVYRDQFRIPPAFLIVMAMSGFTTATMVIAVGWVDLSAYLQGQPTIEGARLFWVLLGIIALEGGLAWMITSWCRVEMDAQGFRISYPPFVWGCKFRSWTEVTKIYVDTVSPIGDLGGWGLRLGSVGPFSRAHVYAFNEGTYALFTLKSGRTVGIQIQRTEDFRKFLEVMAPGIPIQDPKNRLGLPA